MRGCSFGRRGPVSPIVDWGFEWVDGWSQRRSLVVDGQYVAIGDREYSILVLHDDTAQSAAHQTLVRMADQDPLTGVLNRRAFQRWVETAIGEGAAGAAICPIFVMTSSS